MIGHVKSKLASYKAPRHVVPVPSLARAANGKVDHARWRAHATAEVAGSTAD